ncbi:MAG TPA: hypothetical protein VN976_22150 [Verrucomicrobiae bacterium]|nr:hypothetical protein [Verrucomicrobiae bacterium]
MSTPNPIGSMLAEATQTMRSQWAQLVKIAFALSRDRGDVDQISHQLARASGQSEDSIKRKIVAIQYAQSLNFTEEDVTKKGQTQVLSDYGKSRKQQKYEEMVYLKFRIPGSQREVAQQQFDHICQVCEFKTSEQFIDFLIAQLSAASDDELRHAAGHKQVKDAPGL